MLQIREELGGTVGLCEKLGVDPDIGLSSDPDNLTTFDLSESRSLTFMSLSRRRERFGENTLPQAKSESVWRKLLDALQV